MSGAPNTQRFASWTMAFLAMLAALMPAWPDTLGLWVALALLAALVYAVKQRRWSALPWSNALPWMALLYLWHLAGMAWSADRDFGWMDMGMKASLIVFPLLGVAIKSPDRRELQRVFSLFAVSGALVTIFHLVRATILFTGEWWAVRNGMSAQGMPWTNHFFSSYYSPLIHPSYLAWYLAAGVLVWYEGEDHLRHGRWSLPLVSVTGIGVLLCASKLGWLVYGLVIGHVLFRNRRNSTLFKPLLYLVLAGTLVFAGMVAGVRTLRFKVIEAVQAARGTQDNAEDSSALRMQVWDVAVELVREHPLLGTGTGDVKNELIAGYERKGYVHAAEKRLNAHSQFLQTLVALGIPGLLLLLGCTVWPMLLAWRRGQGAMAVFLLSAVLNFSVESMLEVQAGVMFFAFFTTVLHWQQRSTR